MPTTETCTSCKGKGNYTVLVSQHDSETETIVCPKCRGNGIIFVMTEKEEDDYWSNYF